MTESIVWKFFSYINEELNEITCNLCSKKYRSKSKPFPTSSALRHMRSKHSSDYLQYSEKKSNINQNLVNKCSFQKNSINSKIIQIIVEQQLPLNFVESESFRSLLSSFSEDFVPVSTENLQNQVIDTYHYNKKKIFLNLSNSSLSISITTNIWTSVSGQIYAGIIAHYITSKFELNTFCLDVVPLFQSHSSQNLKSQIFDTLKDISPVPIFSVTTGNYILLLKIKFYLKIMQLIF